MVMQISVGELEYITHFVQLLKLKGTECAQNHIIRALHQMKALITEVSDF